MQASEFIIYLQSFVELNGGVAPTPAQWAIINAKLDSVFNKMTPSYTGMGTNRVDVNGPTILTGDGDKTRSDGPINILGHFISVTC